MKTSTRAIETIKRHEGLRLKAYIDRPGGVATIGWGHTRTVNAADVEAGLTISKADAKALFAADLADAEFDVGSALAGAPATQGQWDALVSFTFNLGGPNLRSSTLLRKHREGDYAGAGAEFGRWIYADGKVLPGLIARRAEESRIYLEGLEFDGGATPVPAPKPITKSREIKAGIGAAAGGVTLAGMSAADLLDIAQPMALVDSSVIRFAVAGLVVVAAAMVIWHRLASRRETGR